ncbi:FAD-dependent oxidoreductase [Nonomuraea sp. NPDC050663]|uniref:FAD-dependent oxidoreductase n=1 Tax=Nonomuraea sp. NPDC050663 TaxID=3364370 RepID=UPI003789E532
MRTHIAVIGGGIGGLCLAQGLHGKGVDVAVFERDRTPSDRLQGYRVHIDPQGARALRECLPEPLWRTFLATTGQGGQDFGFLTERLGELLVVETPPDAEHYSVSRITLRQVLLSGLEEIVHFGKMYERYERNPDGTTTLHFADGSTCVADIVVGADGGTSRVRRQYLPHAERIDTGITTVAGKFPLTPRTRALIAPRLADGPNMILPPPGFGMFCAPHDVARAVGEIGRTEQAGALMDNNASYILWAVGASVERFPGGLARMSGQELRATVSALVATWHPDLRRLVELSDPDTVSLLPIRTSVPVEAWEPSTITLLGDAIHSMTPMRGIGANVALRDAALLCAALGDGTVEAIGRYEQEMRQYGFAAVRDSLKAAQSFVSENRLARMGFKAFLRTAARLPGLKEKAFA